MLQLLMRQAAEEAFVHVDSCNKVRKALLSKCPHARSLQGWQSAQLPPQKQVVWTSTDAGKSRDVIHLATAWRRHITGA